VLRIETVGARPLPHLMHAVVRNVDELAFVAVLGVIGS